MFNKFYTKQLLPDGFLDCIGKLTQLDKLIRYINFILTYFMPTGQNKTENNYSQKLVSNIRIKAIIFAIPQVSCRQTEIYNVKFNQYVIDFDNFILYIYYNNIIILLHVYQIIQQCYNQLLLQFTIIMKHHTKYSNIKLCQYHIIIKQLWIFCTFKKQCYKKSISQKQGVKQESRVRFKQILLNMSPHTQQLIILSQKHKVLKY
eukprot:TRINITY_DN8891_c0_g1_i1.p1 TRINITY_DN8891_c0_g1~~TRINITY_DN8891_c0_g1_i1.p1  ORF type:complete len:204 (-),score=-20.76 TRINITY_DN8891_c0_g1_i1:138-749(-)